MSGDDHGHSQNYCFFFCRYLGSINSLLIAIVTTVHQSSFTLCHNWIWYSTLVIVLAAFIPTNALMALRLYNLFRETKYMRYILLSLFILEHAAFFVTYFLVAKHSGTTQMLPSIKGCIQEEVGTYRSFIIMTAGLNLTTTSIYLMLVLKKFFGFIKERSRLKGLTSLRDGNKFVSGFSLLSRSSVIFYLICFGVVLINGSCVIAYNGRELQWIAVPWLVAIYNIAGSRLVMLLGGDLNDSSGVYESGNEFRIDRIPEYELRPSRSLTRSVKECSRHSSVCQ